MKRRQFLDVGAKTCLSLLGLQATGLEALAKYGFSVDPNKVILCATEVNGQRQNNKSYLGFFSLQDFSYTQMEVPMRKAHVVESNTFNSDEILLIKRNGNILLKVSNSEKKVVKKLDIGPDRFSYGHPLFLSKDYFLNPEFNLSELGEGIISLRRTSDLKEVDRFPSFGKIPHQMLWFGEGDKKLLAISNLGEQPKDGKTLNSSVTFVNYETRQLEKKILSERPDETFTHISTSGGHIAISAFQWRLTDKNMDNKEYWKRFAEDRFALTDYNFGPSPIYLIDKDYKVTTLSDPKVYDLLVRTNGIVIDSENGIVIGAHQVGNCVTFWDLKTKKIIKTHRNKDQSYVDVLISPDKKHYLVASKNGELAVFESKTLKLVEALKSFPAKVDHLALGNHMKVIA